MAYPEFLDTFRKIVAMRGQTVKLWCQPTIGVLFLVDIEKKRITTLAERPGYHGGSVEAWNLRAAGDCGYELVRPATVPPLAENFAALAAAVCSASAVSIPWDSRQGDLFRLRAAIETLEDQSFVMFLRWGFEAVLDKAAKKLWLVCRFGHYHPFPHRLDFLKEAGCELADHPKGVIDISDPEERSSYVVKTYSPQGGGFPGATVLDSAIEGG